MKYTPSVQTGENRWKLYGEWIFPSTIDHDYLDRLHDQRVGEYDEYLDAREAQGLD